VTMSISVVVFEESLHGLVRPADVGPAVPDRLACAIAAESVLTSPGGVSPGEVGAPLGCALENLRIAVDVGTGTADGGLAGVVRSGVVRVEGRPPLEVQRGDFELFPRVAGDARRMRYRLWLRDPDGSRWFLRGTKLVVNEAGGGLLRRVWAETTTLYLVLVPLPDDAGGPAAPPSYAGVVRARPLDLLRQLGSLRGEPGPAGGPRAVGRLVSAFRSVIAEVYLHGGPPADFAPGIEVAFGEPRSPEPGQ
jgi:hypothetical protein